jgi:hypothetical protein
MPLLLSSLLLLTIIENFGKHWVPRSSQLMWTFLNFTWSISFHRKSTIIYVDSIFFTYLYLTSTHFSQCEVSSMVDKTLLKVMLCVQEYQCRTTLNYFVGPYILWNFCNNRCGFLWPYICPWMNDDGLTLFYAISKMQQIVLKHKNSILQTKRKENNSIHKQVLMGNFSNTNSHHGVFPLVACLYSYVVFHSTPHLKPHLVIHNKRSF